MVNKADTNKARLNRHRRVRGKVTGTAERPRRIFQRLLCKIRGCRFNLSMQHPFQLSLSVF